MDKLFEKLAKDFRHVPATRKEIYLKKDILKDIK